MKSFKEAGSLGKNAAMQGVLKVDVCHPNKKLKEEFHANLSLNMGGAQQCPTVTKLHLSNVTVQSVILLNVVAPYELVMMEVCSTKIIPYSAVLKRHIEKYIKCYQKDILIVSTFL
jgi:hypothetical protein